MTDDVQRSTTGAPSAFLADVFPFEIFPIELCPLYNFDTVQDYFMKLGRNMKHDR